MLIVATRETSIISILMLFGRTSSQKFIIASRLEDNPAGFPPRYHSRYLERGVKIVKPPPWKPRHDFFLLILGRKRCEAHAISRGHHLLNRAVKGLFVQQDHSFIFASGVEEYPSKAGLYNIYTNTGHSIYRVNVSFLQVGDSHIGLLRSESREKIH